MNKLPAQQARTAAPSGGIQFPLKVDFTPTRQQLQVFREQTACLNDSESMSFVIAQGLNQKDVQQLD